MNRSISLVWFFMIAYSLGAQDTSPKYSNEFLQIGVGARALALGSSTISYSDDANSGYWNPAGLLQMKPDNQLSLMHSAYFGGIANYDFGAFATQLDSVSALSFSVLRFSVDDIADTRFIFDGTGAVNYDNIRYFSASDYAFMVSYARKLSLLKGVRFGGSLKVIHRVVGSFASSWGFGMDAGLQKDFGKWKVGLTSKDIFGTFNSWSYSDAELAAVYNQTGNELSTGLLEITLPRLVLGGCRVFDLGQKFSVMTTLDMSMTFDGKRNTPIRANFASIDPYGGLELGFKKLAFLRIGASQFQQIKDFDGSKSWTFLPAMGVGFKVRELILDYAFTDIGDQAAGLYSHVFSIKVDFLKNGK